MKVALPEPESFYRDELAGAINGMTEWHLGMMGRADIVSPGRFFEVEPIHRWRHGLRQLMAYAASPSTEDLTPCLAVYGVWGDEALKVYLKIRDSAFPVELWLRSQRGRWRPVTSRREARRTN